MQRASTKASLSNPTVIEKLSNLKQNWEGLSDAGKKQCIDELKALDCPYTVIGGTVGMSESSIRNYANHGAKKTGAAKDAPYYGHPLFEIMEMDDRAISTKTQPVVVSRKDQIKQAVFELQRRIQESDRFWLGTLELAKQRCDQLIYEGVVPAPISPELSPKAVFDEYVPADLLDPAAAVEFLAMSLFRLVPLQHELNQLFRELRTKCSSSGLRN
jgi:hypothetical protein